MKDIKLIAQQITIQQLQRFKIDIEAWRNALKSAENLHLPIRKRLYEIYNEIMLDAFLYAIIEKRIRQVKNIPLVFIGKDDKPDYQITQLFETQWMLQLLQYILESIFWGHSLIEFRVDKGKIIDVCLIPRQHVHPETGIVSLKSAYDTDGIKYREAIYTPYTLEVDTKSLGLLNIAAANAIYKKYGKIDFANFVEIFGSPIRHYEYDPNIENAKAEVEELARKTGNSAAIITPKDYANLTILDTHHINSDVHNRFLQELKDELAILVLGQTMTTQNGSSYAQAKIHLEQQNEIKQEDKRFAEYILNHQLKPKLALHGYPVLNGYFAFDDTENLPIDKQLEMDLRIAEKYYVPAIYFEEKYGVPAKDKNTELTTNSQPSEQKSIHQNTNQATQQLQTKHLLSPKKSILNAFKIAFKNLLKKKSLKLDEPTIKAWLDQLLKNGYATPLFQYYAEQFIDAFHLDYKPADIDFATKQGENYLKLRLSILQFAAAKQFALRADILKNTDLPNAPKLFFDRHQNYLQVEKEHFTAIGQMTQKWWDIQNSPTPYIQYLTANDEHVRPNHKKLDKITLPKNHPFWHTHFPPLGYRCRCSVKTVSQTQYDKLPEQLKKEPPVAPDAKEFFNNPAHSGNAIGTQHRYLRQLTQAQYDIFNRFTQTQNAKKAIAAQTQYANANQNFIRHFFNYENGGFLLQHINAHKKDLKKNLNVGKIMAHYGHAVLIREHLEIQGYKNPEFVINGQLSDLKTPDPKKYESITSAIKGAFKSAYKQHLQEMVVEIIKHKETLEDIAEGIKDGFKFYPSIQKVVILKEGKTAEITREMYNKGKILDNLQSAL